MTALDPRLVAGTQAMLALRADQLAAGATHLGWKLGFGSASAKATLQLDRPLVGFLTTERRLDGPHATASLDGWSRPVLEAEIAVHLAADIEPGAGPDDVRRAIAGLAPAIELADLHTPPTDVEAILGGNIYHRHVIIGPVSELHGVEGLTATVRRGSDTIATADDLEELTGRLTETLALTTETLAICSSGADWLRAGDVVITGSVVPPIDIAPGQRLSAQFSGLPPVGVSCGGPASD